MKSENKEKLEVYENFCAIMSIEAKAHMIGFTDQRIIKCLQKHPEIFDDVKFIDLIKRVNSHCSHGSGGTMRCAIEYDALYDIYIKCGYDVVKEFIDMQVKRIPEKIAGPHDPELLVNILYAAIITLIADNTFTIEPKDVSEPSHIIGIIHYAYQDHIDNPVSYLWTDQ